jgi:hypothetical protein
MARRRGEAGAVADVWPQLEGRRGWQRRSRVRVRVRPLDWTWRRRGQQQPASSPRFSHVSRRHMLVFGSTLAWRPDADARHPMPGANHTNPATIQLYTARQRPICRAAALQALHVCRVGGASAGHVVCCPALLCALIASLIDFLLPMCLRVWPMTRFSSHVRLCLSFGCLLTSSLSACLPFYLYECMYHVYSTDRSLEPSTTVPSERRVRPLMVRATLSAVGCA